MRNLRRNLLHTILLLALAVSPLYGLSAEFMPMQHDHATGVSPDNTVEMGVMDCCDGEDGKCHGSSQCQNCPSCQHSNVVVIQTMFSSITRIVPVTGQATLASIHGIVPPVEIRPPQV